MADIWEQILFTASYAGINLDILLTRDEVGRAISRREFPGVDGALLQDEGAKPRTTHARIIFMEKSRTTEQREGLIGLNAGNHIERFELFFDFANQPDSLEFIHPLFGSYPAKVEDISVQASANERDTIMVDCTFIEDSLEPKALINTNASNSFSTRNTVAQTVDDLKAAIDANGVVSEESAALPDDALDAVNSWQEADTSVRDVNQEMARLSSRIADEMEALDLATDLSKYETYRQYTRLHHALTSAASAFRSTRSRISQVTVVVGQPLRTLLVKLYGAAEAENRYSEVIALNDVEDPGYIPAGTVLDYHVPELGKTKGLRSAAR